MSVSNTTLNTSKALQAAPTVATPLLASWPRPLLLSGRPSVAITEPPRLAMLPARRAVAGKCASGLSAVLPGVLGGVRGEGGKGFFWGGGDGVRAMYGHAKWA
jgi:hypothetical protein